MSTEVRDLPNTFTTREARGAGVHPRALYDLRDSALVVELSRGVFRRHDAPVPRLPDLLALAHRAPIGVSALAVHDMTDEIPSEVQFAVPRHARPPTIDHPPVEVFRFAGATFELGLTSVEAAPGEEVRVYGPERTIIDLIRMRTRLGEPLAFGTLRRYVARDDARPGELLRIARLLHVLGPVRKSLDVVVPG